MHARRRFATTRALLPCRATSSLHALSSGSTFVAGLLSCLLSGLVAEESTDPKDLVTEECRTTKCAGAWSAYMEVRPPSPSQLFAPWSAERCKTRDAERDGLGFAQCKERVTTDPKLIANDEAQCTAFYLDFFKCADACVRSRFRPLSAPTAVPWPP